MKTTGRLVFSAGFLSFLGFLNGFESKNSQKKKCCSFLYLRILSWEFSILRITSPISPRVVQLKFCHGWYSWLRLQLSRSTFQRPQHSTVPKTRHLVATSGEANLKPYGMVSGRDLFSVLCNKASYVNTYVDM